MLKLLIHKKNRNPRRSVTPTPHEEVIVKLEKMEQRLPEDTPKSSRQELETEAKQLTNVDKLKMIYLSSLLTPSQQAAERWKNEHSLEATFESSGAYKQAAKRVGKHFRDIARLDVKLYLIDIDNGMPSNLFGRAIVGGMARLMNIRYGPLHAALKVGDVYLEWNDSSLVIPESIENPRQEIREFPTIRFAGDVQRHGSFYSAAQDYRETIRETIPHDHKKMMFTRQMEVVDDLSDHRERLIHNLAQVIANYNTNKEYDVLDCNCQHFVQDCLTALEIDKPVFPHEMQTQLKRLKRGGTISPRLERRRFGTHSDLDKYYTETDKIFSKEELEYISLLYFKFHLRAFKEAGKPEDWKCSEDDCQLDAVQKELLKLHEAAEELDVITSTAL